MTHPPRCLVSLSVGFGLAASPTLGQTVYSLDDWLSVQRVRSFVASPDGRQFYYTSGPAESGTTEIFRIARTGDGPVQISSNPDGVRPEPKEGIVLSGDGQVLYYTTAKYFQNFDNIFSLPTSGGEWTQITFNDAGIETGPNPSPDGRTLAYFVRSGGGTQILLRDLTNPRGWPVPLAPASENERVPLFSPDGSVLAFSKSGDIWVRALPDGEPRRVVSAEHAGGNGSPVWSPDGSRIAFTTGKSGFAQVGVADVATGHVTPITLAAREHGDVSWSPDGTMLVFTRADEVGMSRHVVVARADGSDTPRQLTGGHGIRSNTVFIDNQTVAYIETTDTRTADIWTMPVRGGSATQVTHSMGAIAEDDLSAPVEVFYPGPDNLAIPTLMYRPRNFDPDRTYPVIVRLHGHPGQWNHSMSMEWQYFIQQGFVLIAPNPRGSRGFGQGFHDLHIGDYGDTEFDDVMNVLDYLETLPYVDMTRKATWGGSGGGYMSLVIAHKVPDAFQAQVIRAPVSDWRQLAIDRFGSSGRTWTPTRTPRRERSEFGGSYAEIPEEYDERSPINFVEYVSVPQLLFQGLRDSSVPPNQSQMWAARMEELGKGDLLEYVEYPDEDHGLSRYASTVRDRLQRMDRFFAEHLRLGSSETGFGSSR